MYRKLVVVTSIALSLVACTGEDLSSENKGAKEQVEKEDTVEQLEVEKEDNIEVIENNPETLPMSKEDILKLVVLDNETGQFENGTFILNDNTLIKADMYFFNEGDGYIDGSAIFSDGKLARIKLTLEDDSGIEEAFEQFGIYDIDNIERPVKMAFAYEYTFNKIFDRSNIYRYPFELD